MGEGLVTREDVGGASSDIMDPRPENLNSGIWNQHGCDQKRYGWKPALWKIKQEAVWSWVVFIFFCLKGRGERITNGPISQQLSTFDYGP